MLPLDRALESDEEDDCESSRLVSRGFGAPLLNKTLFRKMPDFLGGRVRLLLSGGAPLAADTHSLTRQEDIFISISLSIIIYLIIFIYVFSFASI